MSTLRIMSGTLQVGTLDVRGDFIRGTSTATLGVIANLRHRSLREFAIAARLYDWRIEAEPLPAPVDLGALAGKVAT